ncbi:MAG: group III truncated hemoglobin [Proteobacteria bacterium]|nr:MAG: group III truncated hemoglobin [Pseudomonadota bacterium]
MNLLAPRQPVGPGALTEADLTRVVHAFYERVREDAELGPVFAGAVADWPAHLATLSSFWSSVMLQSGTYKGNPMRVHRLLGADRVTEARFVRWLGLWRETTNELLPPEAAARLQDKAARMAVNLRQAVSGGP